MTTNPTIKKAIRERMKETGEPYVVARRYIMESKKPNIVPSESDLVSTAILPKVRKLPEALSGQKTITVMGAVGGVGKTITAMCLASAISKGLSKSANHKKVVVVDLDTRDGKIGFLIGQYMPTALSIRVLPVWNAETVSKNLVHDNNLGIDALLAPVRPVKAEDVGPDFYRRIIEILQTTHDVVILNAPSNYLDSRFKVAFDSSDEILLVSTLASTSVEGMARALTELLADSSNGGSGVDRLKVGIVANQVSDKVNMGKDKLLRAAFDAPLVGQIPAEYNAVLSAVNTNTLHELLTHPRLGPAYEKLARMCLPEIMDTKAPKSEELLLGLDDSRGKVYWIPDDHSHLLIGGHAGRGKSYFLKSLFRQIANTDSGIAVITLDQGALSEDIPIWREGNDLASVLSVISEIEELMQTRYTLMQETGVKNYKQLPDTNAMFVIIDEIAPMLNKFLETNVVKSKIGEQLESISRLGRAAGIHMIIATQTPGAIPDILRGNLDARLALGQMDEAYYGSITDMDSDYHLNSWSTDSPFPLVSANRFGEGILCLGNNAIKVTIPTV